jgi:hypothetical protein
MVNNRKLIQYLPQFMRKYEEMVAITDAEQPEINGAWHDVEDLLADQFIHDATERGIARWESMLGISPKGTDTLDERKFRVQTELIQDLPYTMRKLEQTLTNLCGAGQYSVELNSAEYRIEVKIALSSKNNYAEVEQLLKKIIPANMVQVISLLYNTNESIGQFTHAQLSNKTHYQIKSEVLS